MAGDRDDNFLNRWSRRKHAARRGEPLPEPAPPPPVAEAPPPAPVAPAVEPVELPPVESLKGLESEYRDFLRAGVDPETRSAALKKLFEDPHFNQMDGLDVYIDDYTKADPIPSAMLRTLNQARSLGLFKDEEQETGPASGEAGTAATAALEPPPAAAPEPVPEPAPADLPHDATTKTSGA